MTNVLIQRTDGAIALNVTELINLSLRNLASTRRFPWCCAESTSSCDEGMIASKSQHPMCLAASKLSKDHCARRTARTLVPAYLLQRRLIDQGRAEGEAVARISCLRN